jgi:hypothetical protein
MAEIALAALQALGMSAGTTAATAATAATATAATTATAASSSVLNILSGISTAASILGTIGTGIEGARQANTAAMEATLDEGQQQLQSAQRQSDIKRALLKTIGENQVTFAAAGIDVSGGAAQTARQDANTQASRDLSIERRDDDYRRAMLRARARGYKQAAGNAIGGALLKSLGSYADYTIDIAGRG